MKKINSCKRVTSGKWRLHYFTITYYLHDFHKVGFSSSEMKHSSWVEVLTSGPRSRHVAHIQVRLSFSWAQMRRPGSEAITGMDIGCQASSGAWRCWPGLMLMHQAQSASSTIKIGSAWHQLPWCRAQYIFLCCGVWLGLGPWRNF